MPLAIIGDIKIVPLQKMKLTKFGKTEWVDLPNKWVLPGGKHVSMKDLQAIANKLNKTLTFA